MGTNTPLTNIIVENERLHLALEAAQVGFWDYNLVTGQTEWSPICKQLFGLSIDADVNATILLDQVHPDDKERVAEENFKSVSGLNEGDHDIIFRARRKDGGFRWLQAKGKTIRQSDGKVVRFNGIVQDVTLVVTARQQLEASQQQLHNLFEQAPIVLSIVGREPDFVFRLVNEAFSRLVDRPLAALLGKPLLEALPDIAGQGVENLLRQVATTGVPYVQRGAPIKLVQQGQIRALFVDFIYYPLREPNGDVSGVMGVIIDVTEQVLSRKKLEESNARYQQLSTELDDRVQQRTQQLESANQDLQRSNDNLKQFAFIASHDLQEPLRKIQQFGDLLQSQYSDQLEEGTVYITRMQSAANRMSTLIRDLLSFSRISTGQIDRKAVSLADVIDAVLADLDMVVLETNAIVDIHPLPVVQGDASQLGQLFLNLLSNALKFHRSNEQPTISVTADEVVRAELPDTVKPARLASTYHCIKIADNGIGFEEKYLDRIFQVFQRLHGKSEFAGTGIGLAICEKVVSNHGGVITASSQPGQGATFSVYLPA